MGGPAHPPWKGTYEVRLLDPGLPVSLTFRDAGDWLVQAPAGALSVCGCGPSRHTAV